MKTGDNNTNWIENIDSDLVKLFNELLNLFQQSKKRKDFYFPLGKDELAPSYYSKPQHPEWVFYSFIDFSDEIQLKEYLEIFFENARSPEFNSICNLIASLAFKLKQCDIKQSPELTEYVYIMF